MAKMTRTSLLITQKGTIDACRAKVGDYVLCADGRFRAVVTVEKSKGKVWELKGHGHPKLWVPENQNIWSTYYTRKDEGRHFKPFTFSNPSIMKGLFWGSPCVFPAIKAELDKDSAWLMGLVMAAGWANKDEPLIIHVHESKHEDFEARLKGMNLKFFQSSFHTTRQYQVNAPKICKYLNKNMLQTSNRKMVPLEILCGRQELQNGFFEGYLYGKATIEEDKYRMSADNKVEAVSIKLLSQALSLSTALYLQETKIERGTKEYWQIVAEKNARSSSEIGRNRWGLVRDSNLLKGEKPIITVEVEGNHSIIVDGIIFE